MRVLIADDDVVSRHVLEVTLKRWGYEVVSACDGAQAWDILEQPSPPPIGILDWMMPGMTGLDVCRRVRAKAREPYTYLLLLTSRNQKEDLIAGMESGADDYITKPFDQHELQVRLRAGHRIVELQAELLAAREELIEQATHDSLTRAWNRPTIYDILHRELIRAEREHTVVGLVMVDLDHFKRVNDTYGHQGGDQVLVEAARRMHGCIRAYDAIGRYGGEEFLIVLPGCNNGAAESLAERMRSVMERDPVVVNNTKCTQTASFGVASGAGGGADILIARADEALYDAKRRGRNRVCIAVGGPAGAQEASPPRDTAR
jgi:two-component system, cell cycle response regulator